MSPVLRFSEGWFEGVGALRLHYHAWELPRPRAALIVVHGLGEHSGRYAQLAERLGQYNFATFAYDQRGHGRSDGRRGHSARFGLLLQDLDRFRREVDGLVDLGTPLFLLGHSMGGLVALRYLEEYDTPLKGAIIVAPWLATAMAAPRWKVTMAHALERVLPAMPLSTGMDAQALSRDPEIVRAYVDDPLVHDRITPRAFAEAGRAMDLARQRGDRIRVPTLFLLSGQDRVVSTPQSLEFARSLHARDVSVRVRPDSYHELLNEPDRTEVYQEIRDWIAARMDVRGGRGGIQSAAISAE